jgi:glycosyltransferase involved in cell wall biosynthesis
MVLVSVIIPCYNQGQFIDDALRSIGAQTFPDVEIIIVNDGSTDKETNEILSRLKGDGLSVITTENRGLAAARNTGIEAASGKYILPLDADDTIEPDYIKKAVDLLENDPETGIVYCRASLFGAIETDWNLPEYSLERMLLDNIIFCSALFRHDDWRAVGGYDEEMVYGWEDYSFWLSLIERGRKVYCIPENLFNYRVASDSMVRSKEKWQKIQMFKRIYLRHQKLFSENIEVWINAILDAGDTYCTSRLYVDCGNGISDDRSVGRKVEAGTRLIIFDLGEYDNITALRFDPVDTFVILKIERIDLLYDSGRKTKIDQVECNELYSSDDKLYFDTDDPQCYFPKTGEEQLRGVVGLEVRLHFLALGESALRGLVEYQKKKIERKDSGVLTEKIRQAGKLLRYGAKKVKKETR